MRLAPSPDRRKRPGWRRKGAASFDGHDRPSAPVERGRDLGGERRIQGHLELATQIVDTVSEVSLVAQDNGLDLEDVGAHSDTFAYEAPSMH
jgi:hypothetical protein